LLLHELNPLINQKDAAMDQSLDIAVLVGSLRKDSLNRKTAATLAELAPASIRLEQVDIGQLPMYNQDLDDAPPDAWTAFRERIRKADGVLFVTPEYNRSVPAALKNAIDIGSRPYGHSAWQGKPGGVVTVSPGAIGGFGANHHLRQMLVFLDVHPLQQPEAYLGNAGKWFGDDGKLQDDAARKFLQTFIDAYAAWVQRLASSAR
jgi:chromate reductase